jgi:hypothetical protein
MQHQEIPSEQVYLNKFGGGPQVTERKHLASCGVFYIDDLLWLHGRTSSFPV